MTQDEKELVLKDLCARLPYGVKIKCSNCPINLSVTGILGEYIHHVPFYVGGNIGINTSIIEEVKPYLRPMSSMTEEESVEYANCGNIIAPSVEGGYLIPNPEVIDWLDKKMFDYRGLIPMGLAFEAPKDMYQ